MNDAYRRYELLLPRRFDDGADVPESLLTEAMDAVNENLRGQKYFQGYGDHFGLVRMFVDLPDTNENRVYFLALKERLKASFQQLDIWVTTHPLEIL